MKNAIVVEGGAMRGIFAAGVLDAFLEKQFNPFDLAIGVSAGSNNLAGYLSKMKKRSYRIFLEYMTQDEFISWKKFIKGKHYMDLDWLWDLTTKDLPIDTKTLFSNNTQFLIGVTNVDKGAIEYLDPDSESLSHMLKLSSALPVMYKNILEHNGVKYLDGGLTDPIPIKEAIKRGAKNIVVIRSRKKIYKMRNTKSDLVASLFLYKYPALVEAIYRRPNIYNSSLDILNKGVEGINIYAVYPPDEFKTERLTTDKNILLRDYDLGLNAGNCLMEEWNSCNG